MFSFSNKVILLLFTLLFATNIKAQDFQGQAYYFSKTTMDMSRWDRGGKMSEAQKKTNGGQNETMARKNIYPYF